MKQPGLGVRTQPVLAPGSMLVRPQALTFPPSPLTWGGADAGTHLCSDPTNSEVGTGLMACLQHSKTIKSLDGAMNDCNWQREMDVWKRFLSYPGHKLWAVQFKVALLLPLQPQVCTTQSASRIGRSLGC